MSSREERVWIAWETHRRNRELAKAFGARLIEIDEAHQPRAIRYLLSVWRTMQELRRAQPKIIFSQCPSIVLTALLAITRPRINVRWIIDAHNAAFEYPERGVSAHLVKFSFRRADVVIVSNSGLLPSLERLGARGVVLPDKIPDIRPSETPPLIKSAVRPVVTVISTFAPDEPIALFLQATRNIRAQKKFTLFVTGHSERAGDLIRYQSELTHFTGFLNGASYEALIQHSDLLVDLTTREHCLVCGAYEAVAVAVPVFLSDSSALRETFDGAGFFSKNDVGSYEHVLEQALDGLSAAQARLKDFRPAFERRWKESFQQVEQLLR